MHQSEIDQLPVGYKPSKYHLATTHPKTVENIEHDLNTVADQYQLYQPLDVYVPNLIEEKQKITKTTIDIKDNMYIFVICMKMGSLLESL